MPYMLSDFNGALPQIHGSPRGDSDYQQALFRFKALIRPWIIKAGSALDIEELLLHFGLPTSPRDWVNVGKNEIDTLLAIGEFFHTWARIAFDKFPVGGGLTPGENQEFQQIGPYCVYFGSQRILDADLPLQTAISTGSWPAEVAYSFTLSGTHAYSALNGVPVNIYDSNALVLAAGGDFAPVEVGKHRVVIRQEGWDFLIGGLNPSFLVPSRRGGVAPDYGMEIQLNGLYFLTTDATGAPQVGDEIGFANGTGARIAHVISLGGSSYVIGLNGASYGLRPAQGGPAFAGAASAFVCNPSAVTGTLNTPLAETPMLPDPTVAGVPIQLKSYDFASGDAPTEGGMYPNWGITTSPVANLLFPEMFGPLMSIMGGNLISALSAQAGGVGAIDIPSGRQDRRGRAAAFFRTMAGLLEHLLRGHFTETLLVYDYDADVQGTGQNIKELLVDRGLPEGPVQAFGGNQRGTNAYDSGNGTPPVLGERIEGCRGGVGFVNSHIGDGTNGTIGIKLKEGRFIDDDIILCPGSGFTATMRGNRIEVGGSTSPHIGAGARTVTV